MDNNTDEIKKEPKTTSKKNKPDFEKSMARLEEIVSALDGGKVGLEESMKLYEEGIRIARICNSELDVAEQKVKILRVSEDGSAKIEKFGDNND